MKRFLIMSILISVLVLGAFAQQSQVFEGPGSWYDSPNPGLYASHARLPFGTRLLVTNLENDESVTVHIGGRIPEDKNHIIDLSPQAATSLKMNKKGSTFLRVQVIPREKKTGVRASARRLTQKGKVAIMPETEKEFIAAHPSLPMGTKVKVTSVKTKKSTVVTIKYRIRASDRRIIEISSAAAAAIGVDGPSEVEIETIDN